MSAISRSKKDQIVRDALARTHDPKTSWEAAEKVDTNKLESLVLKALNEFGDKGGTNDEVLEYLHDTQLWKKYTAIFPKESSITPRYKQLINKGLVYRDGTTRKGSMGRSQIVNFIVKE
tara:strand:- start:195 stop:551 length:357 start_codon:yes stop_codon:yes gene_type:complete